MVNRLMRTMLEAQAKEALCLKRRRQQRDDSVSRSISLGLLSDPAPTENEADRGQGATSKEQAKEGGRDWAFLRDHAKRCKKAHRAASNAALLVAGQQTVPWAVQREVQRAAQRDAQRASSASAALATDVAPAESCAEGVAAAAALAKMALHETVSRLTASGATPQAASALNRAHELLSPPMVTRGIAEAHDAILAMRVPEDRE
jgi:hypothetical protein